MATARDPCHASRCRVRPVNGEDVLVPRHICRIDIVGRGTHGWQVRFEKPSRFFPDDAGGRSGTTPHASLERAKRYLRAVWTPEPKQTGRNKARVAGRTAGIRLISVRRRQARHWYVEAVHPGRGAARRFYYGTDRTKTPERKHAALRRAAAARAAWLASLPTPTR